uniref:RxLR effector candidate protein n=1 Tax=Hyaloperonospora arabidopsidis (strain Emoy2) TaxID=559515 RepID=M4BFJ2_HYAAE
MKVDAPVCGAILAQCPRNATACFDGIEFCTDRLFAPLLTANRNPYDIRMPCTRMDDPTKCYDISAVSKYLDAPNVRDSLGVDSKHAGVWQECNVEVNVAFYMTADIVKPFNTYVSDLLNDDLRVLIYAGDADLVCNWYGNQAWTLALDWKGKVGFNAAPETVYTTSDGTNGGISRSFNNQLTFLRLFNSGHMVPQDQPAVALDMLNKFLKNETI